MGSVRKTRPKAKTAQSPVKSDLEVIKKVAAQTEVKKYDSLEKGFALHKLKAKRLGDDWRFSTGATLQVDVKPVGDDVIKVVEYMTTHQGTQVKVNVSSILRGAK